MSDERIEVEPIVPADDRYSRLRQIHWWRQDVLRSARVLIVGAGALGNEVLKNLALLGVGSLLIADFDTVEISNLSRSVLYRETDLGQRKAEVAARRVRELNPDVDVDWFHGDVCWDLGVGILRRMNVVLGCLDNRAARLAINRGCWLTGTSWIDGALNGLDGHVRIFVPGQGPCYECTLTDADYAELRRRHSCQGVPRELRADHIPTTPTGASLVAALQTQEAIQLLHGMPPPAGCEIVYSSALRDLRTVRLREKEWCLSHETAAPLIELSWASAASATLGQILAEAQRILGPAAELDLDHEIVTRLVCAGCGAVEDTLAPAYRLTVQQIGCPRCGAERDLSSFHRVGSDAACLDASLADVGIPPAQIVRARGDGAYCYLELTGDFPATLHPREAGQSESGGVS